MAIRMSIDVELDLALWSEPNNPPLCSPWWYYGVTLLNRSKIPGTKEVLGRYTAGPFLTAESALLDMKNFVGKRIVAEAPAPHTSEREAEVRLPAASPTLHALLREFRVLLAGSAFGLNAAQRDLLHRTDAALSQVEGAPVEGA